MDAQRLRLLIIASATALVIGCASTSGTEKTAVRPKPQTVQTPQAVNPVPSPAATPAKQPPPASANTQPPKPPAKDLIQKGEILVTKEEYNKTFSDVHHLIDQLNRIISARDYHSWTEHLTPNYIKTYSDPKILDSISNQPMLKRQHLRLVSLQDYFLNVVVPSRANARLDDLDFVSKTQVKAITVIDGQRYILYNLRFENGSWKIGVS